MSLVYVGIIGCVYLLVESESVVYTDSLEMHTDTPFVLVDWFALTTSLSLCIDIYLYNCIYIYIYMQLHPCAFVVG